MQRVKEETLTMKDLSGKVIDVVIAQSRNKKMIVRTRTGGPNQIRSIFRITIGKTFWRETTRLDSAIYWYNTARDAKRLKEKSHVSG